MSDSDLFKENFGTQPPDPEAVFDKLGELSDSDIAFQYVALRAGDNRYPQRKGQPDNSDLRQALREELQGRGILDQGIDELINEAQEEFSQKAPHEQDSLILYARGYNSQVLGED